MSTSSVFKKIFLPSKISEDIAVTLKQWYPTFVREIEAQNDLPVGKLIPPQRFTKRNTTDGVAGEDLPRCIIVVPGIIGTPVKRNNGQYEAVWRVGIGTLVTASTEDDAIQYAEVLGAATRDIMIKKSGEYGDHTDWLDEAYDDRSLANSTQFYRIAALWFAVTINNVATKRSGPQIPDAEPYVYGEAQTVDVALTKEPLV